MTFTITATWTALSRVDKVAATMTTVPAAIHAATGSSGNAKPEVTLKRSADARYIADDMAVRYAIGRATMTAVRTGRV
jgi:hypothetical protein